MKIKTIALAMILTLLSGAVAFAEGMNHKIAVHVNQNDPKVMNLALNNIQNIKKYYASQGDTISVELVTYGPGLKMLTADSPVKERISVMALESDNLQFSACGNTHRKMSEKAGKKIALLSEAKIVPSGVVRLVELQEKGYAYIKP